MSRSGIYFDDLENALGKGSVTSGYRTQQEQDALRASGATKAKVSGHTVNNDYDLSPTVGKDPAAVRARLNQAGYDSGKIIYEGGGHNNGTGAHFHVSGVHPMGAKQPTTPNGTPLNMSAPGAGVANPDLFLSQLQSQLGREGAASQNVQSSDPSAVFGSDQAIQNAQGEVAGSLAQQVKAVDVLDQVTQAAQATQVLVAREQIQQTRDESNQITAGINELKDKVMPVFQARSRIADQLDKVNSMNPLARAIRGVFDLNYDKSFLEGRLKDYDETLQSRAQDFNYINNLHQAALTEIDRRYKLDTAMPGLVVDQAKEDLGIVGMRLQAAAAGLNSLKENVSTATNLIQAKSVARQDMMGKLDGPTILKLATQARANGGMVTFNGVELNYHEMREEFQKREAQDLNSESYRMAIANNRVDLADKYAKNLATSLTRPQLESAMANGGRFNGIQLDQGQLAGLYGAAVERDRLQASTVASNLPAGQALQTASGSMVAMQGLYDRTKTLFGPQGLEGADKLISTNADLVKQLTQASATPGTPPETITALTQKIAENTKEMFKAADAAILRSTGGDTKAAGYVKAFVYGTPLSQGTATEAITYFAAKGNLPEGVAASPEAKQIFQVAQAEVAAIRQRNPKMPMAQVVAAVNTKLAEKAPNIVGNARFTRLFNDLPAIAARAGQDFGKIGSGVWSQIQSDAQNQAATYIAGKIGGGVTPQQVIQMANSYGPLDKTQASQQMYDKFNKLAGDYNAQLSIATLKGLDHAKQVHPGVANSQLFIDFINSPHATQATTTYTQAYGARAMGDFLANPISQGAVESRVQKAGQSYRQAYSAMTSAARSAAQNQPYGMLLEPSRRVQTILGAIPGLGEEGSAALMPFVNNALKDRKTPKAALGDIKTINAAMRDEEAYVEAQLAGAKFNDPRLEAYRKLAVKNWKDYQTRHQSTVESIVNTMGAVLNEGVQGALDPRRW